MNGLLCLPDSLDCLCKSGILLLLNVAVFNVLVYISSISLSLLHFPIPFTSLSSSSSSSLLFLNSISLTSQTMFTPLRDGSLSVEVPDSLHIENVHDVSTHDSMSVQTSESVQDLRGLNETQVVIDNEAGFVRGLSVQDVSLHNPLSVQEVGSTGYSLSFQKSEYIQYPLSVYPVPVQIVQVPKHIQEDEENNPSHMFPHLSLAAKPESPSSASLLTSQLPGISLGRSLPRDPSAGREEGQIAETNVTSEPVRDTTFHRTSLTHPQDPTRIC